MSQAIYFQLGLNSILLCHIGEIGHAKGVHHCSHQISSLFTSNIITVHIKYQIMWLAHTTKTTTNRANMTDDVGVVEKSKCL